MQEYCPLCSKNGVQAKIKAFQLNFEEAVFMCSSKECTWPVGYQELLFMNRPVGVTFSNTWEESARQYLKSRQDVSLEFQAYTPPQTPGTEIKDNSYVSGLAAVSESMPMIGEDNVYTPQEVPTSFSKPCDSSSDNSINNGTNIKPKLVKDVNYSLENLPLKACASKKDKEHNGIFPKVDVPLITNVKNLKPKLMTLKSVNYNVKMLQTNSCNIRTINENNGTLPKVDTQLNNLKDVSTNKSTSLANKSAHAKASQSRHSLSTVKTEPNSSLKMFNRTRPIARPYRKFEFNKAKSKIVTDERKIDLVRIDRHATDRQTETQECLNVCDSNVNNVQNDNTNLANVDFTVIEPSVNSGQIDFDSIMAFTNCSKDSGVETMEGNDFDFDEDLLSGFSDELCSASKPVEDDTDDCQSWVDALFE